MAPHLECFTLMASGGILINCIYVIKQKIWRCEKPSPYCFCLHFNVPKSLILNYLADQGQFTGLLDNSNFAFAF